MQSTSIDIFVGGWEDMKGVEKMGISIVNLISIAVSKTGIYKMLRRMEKEKCIILMYHGITRRNRPLENFDHKHVESEKFEQQLRFLKKNYSIISLEDFIFWKSGTKANLPPNALVLTFDDGYKNLYTVLLPIIKKYNVPMTVFLPTSYIGKSVVAWYDAVTYCIARTTVREINFYGKKYSLENEKKKIAAIILIKNILKQEKKERRTMLRKITEETAVSTENCDDGDFLFLTWEQCKEMEKYGVSFESHSATHQVMAVDSEEEITRELASSKSEIEERLQEICHIFSYPFGVYNEKVKVLAAKAGYRYCLSTEYGKNTRKTDDFKLCRIAVNNLYSEGIFALTLFMNFPLFHHSLIQLYSKVRRMLF